MSWLGKTFDPAVNRVHVISLSCNPVPPERYGGIELVIAHLCEGLAEKGARAVCYSPGRLQVQGNVEHYRTLPEPTAHIKEGGVPNTLEHLQAVAAGLKANVARGDVVVFNHPDHYRYLKRRLGLRVPLTAFMCEVAHWTAAGMQRNVIYPSASLQRAIGKPGTCIPHGERLIFRDPLAQKENYLFFAGRITRDKGVDIALAACVELRIKLVLAGPLNDKAFAAEIIGHPSVEYLGELRYHELVPYYNRAKALVYMTQYTEPFGLSVIEAMATGCPVITTGKGGTGETVLDGTTGFFCQTASDIALAYPKLESLRPADCVTRAMNYSIGRMATSYLDYFRNHAA